MLKVIPNKAFRKDVKRLRKRGYDIDKLFKVIDILASGVSIDQKYKPHPLKGNWKPSWDLHIAPDWILIYELTDEAVYLVRTGTHADLF
ncbi:MAG: type II toxin-antitoxin system YafQ family toxin [Deinococcota bacterium]